MRNVAVILSVASIVFLSSCSRNGQSRAERGKPIVFVCVAPQAYLAERIAGGRVEVDVLVKPGQSPHTYEPTPRQLVRLSKARAFLRIHMPFEEALIPKLAQNKHLRIVDTCEGIALIPTAEHHDEHKARQDAAQQLDPHVWMSPRLAKILARNICDALVQIDPAHQAEFQANLEKLCADLDAVDAEIAAALAPLKGRTFYVFHPAFGYFARRYGLVQQAVQISGKSPGPKHIGELIDKARRDRVRVIFVQPQFSQRAARTIAEQIGGAVVPVDPLARDYIANLRDLARKIRRALSSATSPAPAREP